MDAGRARLELPVTPPIGDVVEFGVGWTNSDGSRDFDRWWGWIERGSHRALIVVGPYDIQRPPRPPRASSSTSSG